MTSVSLDLRSVQAELLLPFELAAALDRGSVAYLPLGTIEWHSAHLPIGVDGLTAHGVCTRAAARTGGVVLPPLFYGVGGGHSDYPWTIMATSAAQIDGLVSQSLSRLDDFGVETAVLFTGHFPDEQIELVEGIADRWNTAGHRMRVVALSISQAATRVPPDHAGVFETSMLSAMWPDRVRLDQLPTLADGPADDPGGDAMGAHRHQPDHPLYGVFGPDPRHFDPAAAPELLEDVVAWTIHQLASATDQTTMTRSEGRR